MLADEDREKHFIQNHFIAQGFGHEQLMLPRCRWGWGWHGLLLQFLHFEHSSDQEVNGAVHVSFNLVQLSRTSNICSRAHNSKSICSKNTLEDVTASQSYKE